MEIVNDKCQRVDVGDLKKVQFKKSHNNCGSGLLNWAIFMTIWTKSNLLSLCKKICWVFFWVLTILIWREKFGHYSEGKIRESTTVLYSLEIGNLISREKLCNYLEAKIREITTVWYFIAVDNLDFMGNSKKPVPDLEYFRP